MKIKGQLVDIHKRKIFPAIISIEDGIIMDINETDNAPERYIMPGLIDSHIHIESSMITPGAFALMAVRHGTIGVVSDPHEIANVLGIKGVRYMLRDSDKVPLKFWFGASSCVPATDFETSGGRLDVKDVQSLLRLNKIKYLSEMMNFPGVIFGNEEVMKKIEIAKKYGKPVDGHAPGLSGEMLKKYIDSGISTDHECTSLEEAKEKISLGMKILIREGSAARNLDALKELFVTNPDDIMLCSDDLHPEMLMKRHINKLVAGLVSEGFDLFNVLRSVTVNPVKHYGLEAGLLQIGDLADFIIVDNPGKMNVQETWIEGKQVYSDGMVGFSYLPGKSVNNFNCKYISTEELIIENSGGNIRVIEAFDGDLVTKELDWSSQTGRFVNTDESRDILKIVVKDRYRDMPPVAGFIKGFGLKKGAFASSIAHDSHNIICVGTNDLDITYAINRIVEMKGGLAVSYDGDIDSLKLDIAGIMTTGLCEDVASNYLRLSDKVNSCGCKMKAPFMTLSFMALLVIPDLKIGDRGLFDVKKFKHVSLFL